MSRIVFDLTSLARWTGPPVGIVRVQQMLAQYAHTHRPDVVFSIFDPDRWRYRKLRSEFIRPILDRTTIVEMSLYGSPTGSTHRFQDRLPSWARSLFYWCTKTRRKLLFGAEYWRIGATNDHLSHWMESVVNACMKPKERCIFFDENGNRRNCAAFSRAAGDFLELGPNDITLATQFDWAHTNIGAIAREKQRRGFRHVVLCYDIIPILFPEWYYEHDVRSFRDYYDLAFRTADCIIVNSHKIQQDVRDYLLRNHISLPATSVVPLGADRAQPAQHTGSLPATLRPNKYILFVSTIEPRKNHAMLVNVWRRLLREQIPQTHGFQLVFVGRPGWKMDDFIPNIQRDTELRDTIHILHGVDDECLARLYQDAAFCVYPPIYEGFGLPAIEAISYGKPLLASNGGSIPEAVGDAAVCLDPRSEDTWYQFLRNWIVEPMARRMPGVTSSFRPRTWEESARHFFQAIDTNLAQHVNHQEAAA